LRSTASGYRQSDVGSSPGRYGIDAASFDGVVGGIRYDDETYQILHATAPGVVVLVVGVFVGFLGELGDCFDLGCDLRFCCLND